MNEDFVYSSEEYCPPVRARLIIHTHSTISISKILEVRTREFTAALGNAEGAPTAIIDALKAHTEKKSSEFFQAVSLQIYEILIGKYK